jgi:uncharacterized protein (DUF1684 family)
MLIGALASAIPGPLAREWPSFEDSYIAGIVGERKTRDEQYRSKEWSPLAVVAIARLDRERTSIGSSTDADLHLDDPGVAGIHAEIIRQSVEGGGWRYQLRALSGTVRSIAGDDETAPVELKKGTSVRIGRFVVYFDYLGTFGAVVRAMDFTTPAYTGFQGLPYFPVDVHYRVKAQIEPYPSMVEIQVLDTNGWTRPAWKYGEAHFSLDGKSFSLVVWLFTRTPKPADQFFIAFSDSTAGRQTYHGGRYVDVHFVPSGEALLDFNRAYNPSCAYNAGFACPLPPSSNRLTVPIRAGEKTYPHH